MKSKDRTPASVTGHRWMLWKRVDIADIGDQGSIYLTRFILLLTPFFGIYVHKINRPDGDHNLHDHPWSFLAIILKGGYTEQTAEHPDPSTVISAVRQWKRWSVHRVMRGTYHGISRLHEAPTWTLCLVGPRRGTWGFYDPSLPGWVQYEEYFDRHYPGWRESDTHAEGNIRPMPKVEGHPPVRST